MGALEWPPAVFWASTPHELFAAIDGRKEANGHEDAPVPPTREEVAEMMQRFPDYTVH